MQQHRHVIGQKICGDQVGGAVFVQVGHRHRKGAVTHKEGLLGLEGAIAIAQQHRHVIRTQICGDEVGDAVAVQVSHRHRAGVVTHGEGLLGLEGAIATAQQHRDVIRTKISGDQVGDAVGVQVPPPPPKRGRYPRGRSAGAGRCHRHCPAAPTRHENSNHSNLR